MPFVSLNKIVLVSVFLAVELVLALAAHSNIVHLKYKQVDFIHGEQLFDVPFFLVSCRLTVGNTGSRGQ